MIFKLPSPIQELKISIDNPNHIRLYIKRDDLIHKIVSGNKWRKLKYNFEYIKKNNYKTVLSFGGAFSNHLHALSWIANQHKIQSIGLVRGEESSKKNPTLSFCAENNMSLYFLNRTMYRECKYSNQIINFYKREYKDLYILPEGGFNKLGIKGCEEIIDECDINFDIICCSIGSGCTAAGLINSLRSKQKFLGFSSFKNGGFLKNEIKNHINKNFNWDINCDYNFGGFGKINSELLAFMSFFKHTHNIQLDPIYTSKLLFGLFDMIAKKKFPKESRILVLHTGGLQGLQGI